MSHHAKLQAAYIRQLLHLQDTFGAHLPDVVFVVTTGDTPKHVSGHVRVWAVGGGRRDVPAPVYLRAVAGWRWECGCV